jgi:hypothetical protein
LFPTIFADLLHTWIARRAARNRLATYPAAALGSRFSVRWSETCTVRRLNRVAARVDPLALRINDSANG